MRKLRQCSWKRGDCRSGKKIFAVEAVRLISGICRSEIQKERKKWKFFCGGRERKTADHQQSGNVLPGCTWIPGISSLPF